MEFNSGFKGLNSALPAGDWSKSRLADLGPGTEVPGTVWLGVWLGSRVGRGRFGELINLLHLPNIWAVWSLVTILTTLYDILVCYMKNILSKPS